MSMSKEENLVVSKPSPVCLTDAAALKVHELITEEGSPELKLRSFITGGGCSGFQYGFTFDEKTKEHDTIIIKSIVDNAGDSAEVTLLVDSLSIQYLKGATIDYIDDVEGSRFVITNPNAKTTCGCGSSFSA